MIPRFEFATAARVVFGAGTIQESGRLAADFGARALVVTGRDPARAQPLLDSLHAAGVPAVLFGVAGEPAIETINEGVAVARKEGCGAVVAFGGGSAIDAGKAIAAMLANPGELLDYLEVIGGGKTLPHPSAPLMAIPTTAGTGSEVTRNAVLTSPAHKVKVSLRGAGMLPRIALVDPELTHSLPRAVTASTGLDALTQLIEPYTCCRTNPMVDALCVDGIRRAARSLRRACDHRADADARADMSLASLFGGLALANAGLGAVHGVAGPFGGMFDAPHGATCAALLPYVMEANRDALRQRAPGSAAARRYEEIARLLTGDPSADAASGSAWVHRLVRDLDIPPLSAYGWEEADLPELAAKAAQASSMKANPIVLTTDELITLLRRARRGEA